MASTPTFESLESFESVRGSLSLSPAARRQAWLKRLEQCRSFNAVAQLAPDCVWEPALTEGVLAGLPILVKDNINVAGLTSTAGSLHLPANPQAADAPVVARLKAAGAVVAGKTTLSELSGFVSTHLPPGYSQRWGRTVNGSYPGCNPGGSSSGSAAAVACGLVPLALGTETNGSVLLPAMRQGVVGFKPTFGRIPTEGIVPISRHLDTVGFLAHACADIDQAFRVCADSALDMPLEPVRRLGVVLPHGEGAEAALAALRGVCDALNLTVTPITLPSPYTGYKELTSGDIRGAMTRWLQTYGDGAVPDFDALVERYRVHPHPYGADRLLAARDFVGETALNLYEKALAEKRTLAEALAALFEREKIDAVLAFSYETVWAMTGFPQLTLPLAGRPLFVGMRSNEDGRLLAFAGRLQALGYQP